MDFHGARVRHDGNIRFRLWAPACDRIRVEIPERNLLLPLTPLENGWHELISDAAAAGDRYFFVLPDGRRVPDPASCYQPNDAHGPSELIDFRKSDDSGERSGVPWEGAVIYELHVGAFTPEGDFRGAIGKLDHLCSTGITALQFMPIGDFPGRRNWGYDGVLPFAPDSTYGRPEDLMALVNAVHERGMMALLDVVYNHFGPEGNYLSSYAPDFFTDRRKTPWGSAINFDGPASGPVREFFIQNALHWLGNYGFDGLRVDAVHAIADESPKHILAEISERIRAAFPRRRIHLVLENEENEACWLERNYTAQWNDDVHHVLHTAITSEDHGYYRDYRGDTRKLGRALAEGFAYQGEIMDYRGTARGAPCTHLAPTSFIAFLQNHDQIGNRAFGERISTLASPESLRAATAVYLLLPQVPMLFMGEEWGAEQPFPFFCDFDGDLGDKVREGRRNEFARFPAFQDPQLRETIPDPQACETFCSAKVRWQDIDAPEHREYLDWYSRLLGVRRNRIVPLLGKINRAGEFQIVADGAVSVAWRIDDTRSLVLAANLSPAAAAGFPPAAGDLIWIEGSSEPYGCLGPWSVRWSISGDSNS